jgi:hypothetical protein
MGSLIWGVKERGEGREEGERGKEGGQGGYPEELH